MDKIKLSLAGIIFMVFTLYAFYRYLRLPGSHKSRFHRFCLLPVGVIFLASVICMEWYPIEIIITIICISILGSGIYLKEKRNKFLVKIEGKWSILEEIILSIITYILLVIVTVLIGKYYYGR